MGLFYKTDTAPNGWDYLKTKYTTDILQIGDGDWSFDDIGIIETETWENDHDGDGEYSTYFNSKLMEVDTHTGCHNWVSDPNVRVKFEDA